MANYTTKVLTPKGHAKVALAEAVEEISSSQDEQAHCPKEPSQPLSQNSPELFPFKLRIKATHAESVQAREVKQSTSPKVPPLDLSPVSPQFYPPKRSIDVITQAPPPMPSSPELFTKKRKSLVPPVTPVPPPVANQRNYDSVTKAEYNWGPSTPEILEALEMKEGKIDYRNGIYDGQLEELQPHGKGMWQGIDGSFYEGDWVYGEFHGQGSYRDARDNFYNGGWKAGKRDGEGVYLFRNGDWYQGEWREGNMHGNGEASYAHSGDIYRGGWKDNLRHGQGTSFIACNKPAFRGKYITFKGVYRQNLRQGTFVITTPQGSQCTLNFKNGKPIPDSSRLIKISRDGAAQYSLDRWLNKAK